MICKRCKAEMNTGIATQQTYVGGLPDFIGDKHSSTFSAGGPGLVVECWKCPDCGWSMTKPQDSREEKRRKHMAFMDDKKEADH